jgi:hypothetical protein
MYFVLFLFITCFGGISTLLLPLRRRRRRRRRAAEAAEAMIWNDMENMEEKKVE